MSYPCEAKSEEAFVQYLAVSCIRHGYHWYVTGRIPEGKNPRLVDEKLTRKYGLDISKWARARRKANRRANLRYLRHGRFFVLIATEGEHDFYDEEAERIRNVRYSPIYYGGYSVGYRRGIDKRWHASVRIEKNQYLMLRDYFLDIATHRSADALSRELFSLPFAGFGPVRQQLLTVLRAINRKRRKAGFELVPLEALRLSRKSLKVFVEREEVKREAA